MPFFMDKTKFLLYDKWKKAFAPALCYCILINNFAHTLQMKKKSKQDHTEKEGIAFILIAQETIIGITSRSSYFKFYCKLLFYWYR